MVNGISDRAVGSGGMTRGCAGCTSDAPCRGICAHNKNPSSGGFTSGVVQGWFAHVQWPAVLRVLWDGGRA